MDLRTTNQAAGSEGEGKKEEVRCEILAPISNCNYFRRDGILMCSSSVISSCVNHHETVFSDDSPNFSRDGVPCHMRICQKFEGREGRHAF